MRINPRVSIAVTLVLGPAPRPVIVAHMLQRYRQALYTKTLVRPGQEFNPPVRPEMILAVIEQALPWVEVRGIDWPDSLGRNAREVAERALFRSARDIEQDLRRWDPRYER